MAATKASAIRNVTVTVKDYVIHVKPALLKMGNAPMQIIQWEIKTKGWSFPMFEDGIEVKGDHGEFSNGRVDDSGLVFTMYNKNSHEHIYPYTVKVTNGKTTVVLDPEIQNGGHN